MKCGACVYYCEDICYLKGTRVLCNGNICENFIKLGIDWNDYHSGFERYRE